MLCAPNLQSVQRGYAPTVNGAQGPFNRRTFLMCALASGAAMGVGGFGASTTASPLSAGSQNQDDSQFTVEAKFYQKLKRSEEHTSELQSLRHLVCRLL